MKKLLTIALASVLVLSIFSGCGVKEKLEQKAGEAIGEKMLEGLAGEGVDIDLDGEEVVIKGSDGEEMQFGSGEWPDSDLAKTIPEYKDGKIDGVFTANDSCQVTINETDEKYFADYLDKIKKDFSKDSFEGNSEGSITYSGTDEDGNSILIFYEDEECVISLAKASS
ncbi:MAG: hypothetical protein GX028_09145 [Clostridiaceae bacterium]|nr:hypothetical protein [Clostridiaceae bacterium]